MNTKYNGGNNQVFVLPAVDKNLLDKSNTGANRWHSDNTNYAITAMPKSENEVVGKTFAFSKRNGNDPLYKEEPWWNGPEYQPVPAGWAIPTVEQMRSIFPTTPFAGNITYCPGGNSNNPSVWGENVWNKLGTDVVRICVPYYSTASDRHKLDKYATAWEFFEKLGDEGCLPENESSYYTKAAYEPGATTNRNTEPLGDPAPGYVSVYVIADYKGDRFTNNATHVNNGWGTIYGIKKYGTNEAYRMRWEVENYGTDPDYPLLAIKISRYTCTANTRLTVENYKSFDWDHPVNVLYFPISGLVEGNNNADNLSGKYFYCGYEGIYATSSRLENGYNPILRIKITGDVKNNQYISVIDNDFKTHGKQIRLVRVAK